MNALQCRWLRCKHTHLMLVNDFFSPLELWCDEAWGCQSFLSFFLYLSTCAPFICDLRTVHLLVVVTKPTGYCRKQTRHEQTLVSHTHRYPFYTRLISLYVCSGIRLTLSLHVASERTEAGALCCLWTFWKGSSSIYKVLKSPRWGCKDVSGQQCWG